MLRQQPGGQNSLQSMILDLTNWMVVRPQCQKWMNYAGIEEENAGRVLAKILLANVQDLCAFSGDPMPSVVHDITHGNEHTLYGVCDKYHIAHEEMLKWIKKWIDIPEPLDKDPQKKKAWQKMNSVMDYYGKTGTFSLQLGRRTKSRVVYVDQNPFFAYAKFRFRTHRVHYNVRSIEAQPTDPRPIIEDKFGFISSLEVPILSKDLEGKPIPASQDWVDWFAEHLFPLGFVATCAELPWKKVARLDDVGYIYQYVP